ncbi:MAG: polyprenyl synthetase family protein, partial [Actinomycetia bacterium]|nr:polyprenyl synthetase family protein [Actinomycetes bacterium]
MRSGQDFVNKKLEDYLIMIGGNIELSASMRYALLGGGKRVRPLLLIAVYDLLKNPDRDHMEIDYSLIPDNIILLTAVVEMIHTYSLIHDDLPCMDDDELRRGQPTVHVKYNEALAVLAGDGLLTGSFFLLSRLTNLSTGVLKTLIDLIGAAAGADGMIGGQVADIDSEGEKADADKLRYIHENKTMKMIRLPLLLGTLLAEADSDIYEKIKIYGEKLGMLFQITDDILDITSTAEKMGKPAGSDNKLKKSTYPALFGLSESKEIASNFAIEAVNIIESVSKKDNFLA